MFRSTAPFDKALDKATSQLLLEPDWDAILQICDLIRQNDIQPKEAILRMKKKVQAENPHVAMFALQTLESVVKNCGDTIHKEVATKEFMEFMKDEAKKRPDPVKGKVLELVQVWSHAFRNDPTLKAVQDTYHLMKMEGYKFPTLKESDAMFVSEKAPEWKDGEVCFKCRVTFNTFNRKHHCRNCGQVFCGKCSSKNSIIPKFGIEKEVRVCDTCHEQLGKPSSVKKSDDEGSLPSEYLSSPLSKQSQAPPAKSEQELQEEEELQLAIALSKSEAENKERQRDQLRKSYGYSDSSSSGTGASNASYQQPVTVSAPVFDAGEMDPELARYLNRNYWEKRQESSSQQGGASSAASGTGASTAQPSAPAPAAEPKVSNIAKVQEQYQNGETNDEDQFLNALRSSIEIFVNRMKSDSMRGRNIANDSAVQTLFMTINAMHPELMKHMSQQEDLRAHYEALQDKLTQLKEARDALDALREDHKEKMRREAEERERQRQIQMQQKLEIMRQKKHEYLEYQRQLAVQRMQEQDRLMNMRLAQQKQMVQMREMQYGQFGQYNQPYAQQVPQGYPSSGSAEGSPVHMMHHQQQQPGAYGQPPPPQHMGPGPAPGMVGQPPHMGPPGGPGGPGGQGPQPPMGPQGPMGSQGAPPGQPPMANQPYNPVSSQQMYTPQGQGLQGYQAQAGMPPAQTAPAPYQQGPPPQGPPSGSYQPPPTVGQQQPMYTGQPPQSVGGGAVSGGHGAPSPVPQGYGHPGGPEYNSYNMQSMANALPGNNQGQPQGYMPAMGQYQQPPQQHYQQGGPPPQQQPPQQQPQPREAELISFD
ncbi:hepatocyte growth factor-regulated tyrosine kinase substrate [Lingula anatina]|uniref:Hepatocyte growth factor-regulated tyrosine kinase substrate n=1 Tax=Lingula anatina TaxID=7574 RepID=A0A1S3JX40_LINAN|nr:hepatocyte growth factor-regulated tyrosine kinase substrate [Lingula anatina]|eukprot:XP_013414877.1 hepatocyte growth factor-regulated tyrosine kinase substrate [Lingula anatina]